MKRQKLSTRWFRFMLLVGYGLFVLGLTTSHAEAKYDPELVKRAKEEGKYVWYGCVPDHPQLLKAFEKRFGIATEYVFGICYPTLERFRTEQRAGRYRADTFHGFSDIMLTMKKQGFLVPYKSPFLTEYDPRFHVAGNFWTTLKPHAYFFTVNEKVFPDKSLWPKKWSDYLNPPAAWKDKIALFDPRSSSAAYHVVYSLYRHFGEEKWRKIYANVRNLNPSIYTGSSGGIQACVTGEKPVMFYMMNNHIAKVLKKGAPLPVITPGDGTTYIVTNLGVIKNAPHPNAARLMVDFMLDPEGGQKVYREKMNQYALHPSIEPPKGFPRFRDLDLWDIDFVEAEEMRADLQKKWAEIMGVGTK